MWGNTPIGFRVTRNISIIDHPRVVSWWWPQPGCCWTNINPQPTTTASSMATPTTLTEAPTVNNSHPEIDINYSKLWSWTWEIWEIIRVMMRNPQSLQIHYAGTVDISSKLFWDIVQWALLPMMVYLNLQVNAEWAALLGLFYLPKLTTASPGIAIDWGRAIVKT